MTVGTANSFPWAWARCCEVCGGTNPSASINSPNSRLIHVPMQSVGFQLPSYFTAFPSAI